MNTDSKVRSIIKALSINSIRFTNSIRSINLIESTRSIKFINSIKFITSIKLSVSKRGKEVKRTLNDEGEDSQATVKNESESDPLRKKRRVVLPSATDHNLYLVPSESEGDEALKHLELLKDFLVHAKAYRTAKTQTLTQLRPLLRTNPVLQPLRCRDTKPFLMQSVPCCSELVSRHSLLSTRSERRLERFRPFQRLVTEYQNTIMSLKMRLSQ